MNIEIKDVDSNKDINRWLFETKQDALDFAKDIKDKFKHITIFQWKDKFAIETTISFLGEDEYYISEYHNGELYCLKQGSC